MTTAVVKLVNYATWNMALILRTERCFTDGELVNLYTSQLLPHIENRTVAICHACDNVITPLTPTFLLSFHSPGAEQIKLKFLSDPAEAVAMSALLSKRPAPDNCAIDIVEDDESVSIVF